MYLRFTMSWNRFELIFFYITLESEHAVMPRLSTKFKLSSISESNGIITTVIPVSMVAGS